MTEVPPPAPPAPRRPSGATPDFAVWHLGFGVGAVAAGAALLAALGDISWTIAGALGSGAAAGFAGYLWRPSERSQRLALVVLWAVAAAAAAALQGGLTGPLGIWCVLPLLAGALLGAPAEGAVFSAAALGVLVLVEIAGAVSPAARGAFGVGLAAAGLLTAGGAAVAAILLIERRMRAQAKVAAGELAWLRGTLSELPHLVLALDPTGRPEAVFGTAPAGFEPGRLAGGLLPAVAPEDRPAVEAALAGALVRGQANVLLHPAAEPDRLAALALRRRGEHDLCAALQEADPAVVAGWAEERSALQARLDAAADTAATLLARATALQRKLETTELARNRAYNLLAKAGAAMEAQGRTAPSRAELETRLADTERKLAAAEAARDQVYRALAGAEAARARAEAARADAEAQAVGKSRFLANMSHELRTPLNAIMGFSDVMRSRLFGDLPPKYAEYGELIHEAGRHLTDLINDVLDMSKIEAERYTLSRERFDAREAVNAALRLVRLQADEAGVQLRGVLPAGPLPVDADRRALKQMVLNLVSNSLKFTPSGGSIVVTAQAAAGAFELVVADTGVGIAKEDLERLGRPFEQAGDAERRAQGTGLGLSLVKALAGLHGGEMSIESELGEGATVTLRLPVLAEQPAAPDGGGPETDRPRGGVVIPLNLMR